VLLTLLLLSPPSCRHSVPIKQVGCRASSAAPRTAPLSPPAISSSTHTHNAQVPLGQYLPCLTQSCEQLFPALSALSSPLALLPAEHSSCRYIASLRSLTAEHAAAHSPSALEGLPTRATHRHQFILCSGRSARTPLRIAARALLALQSVRLLLPPFSSSAVFRPRAPSQK
jgi:hypothetical protein